MHPHLFSTSEFYNYLPALPNYSNSCYFGVCIVIFVCVCVIYGLLFKILMELLHSKAYCMCKIKGVNYRKIRFLVDFVVLYHIILEASLVIRKRR